MNEVIFAILLGVLSGSVIVLIREISALKEDAEDHEKRLAVLEDKK